MVKNTIEKLENELRSKSRSVKSLKLLFNQLKEDSGDIDEDLILSFKQVLNEEMSNVGNDENNFNKIYESALTLIELSLQLVVSFAKDSNKQNTTTDRVKCFKIPYLLIEDLLEDCSVMQAEIVWKAIEAMMEQLTSKELYAKGKIIILRFCNALLKRLSKSVHTEFLGRVLMFMASAFPVSERSAVNLLGRINLGNITTIESVDEYKVVSDNKKDTNSEKMDEEDEEDGEEEELKVNGILYDVYKTFWGLQSVLASETKELDSLTKWENIMDHTDQVLSLFEEPHNTFSELELKQEKERYKALCKNAQIEEKQKRLRKVTDNIKDEENEKEKESDNGYVGTKYLTSSKLLSLQVRDPLLRQQLATQLLFFTHHIRARPPQLELSELPMKKGRVDKALVKEHTAAMWSQVQEDLEDIERRAYTLVASTPPNGNDFAAILKRLLQRENNWVLWKLNGCQPFEKNDNIDLPDINSLINKVSKEKASKDIGKAIDFVFPHDKESINLTLNKLSEETQNYDAFIQDYLDADDPECGIEEEYHPKHDALYCWRARRLMSSDHLHVFDKMVDGDISIGLEGTSSSSSGDAASAAIKKYNGEIEMEAEILITPMKQVSSHITEVEVEFKTENTKENETESKSAMGSGTAVGDEENKNSEPTIDENEESANSSKMKSKTNGTQNVTKDEPKAIVAHREKEKEIVNEAEKDLSSSADIDDINAESSMEDGSKTSQNNNKRKRQKRG